MRRRAHTLRVLSPGTRLGRYEIRSRLGADGMGEVDLAQDTRLDRKVAVKILLWVRAAVLADFWRRDLFTLRTTSFVIASNLFALSDGTK
jgi:hypothetical protein